MRSAIHIAAGILCAAAVSCGGSDKNESTGPGGSVQATPVEPDPGGAGEAPERSQSAGDLEARYDECIAAFNNRDEEAFGACYTEDATSKVADAPMVAKGRAAIVEANKKMWTAFPDLRIERQLILQNGDKAAAVALTSGTFKNPLYGVPPTGEKQSQFVLHVAELDPEVGRARGEMYYQDLGQMAGQLGVIPGPHRPHPDMAFAEKKTVVAEDSETERANIEVVESLIEAFNAHDKDQVMEHYAEGAILSHTSLPADQAGKKAIRESISAYLTAFADVKHENVSTWAAGDYVVNEQVVTGTHEGDLMGLKPTGRDVELHQGEIFLLEDGKVKRHWIFQNGLALSLQLGAVEDPTKK